MGEEEHEGCTALRPHCSATLPTPHCGGVRPKDRRRLQVCYRGVEHRKTLMSKYEECSRNEFRMMLG